MNSPLYTGKSVRAADEAPKKIGHLLIEYGTLDDAKAERVAAMQKANGMRFGETARLLNLVSEADIERALAEQLGYTFLRPGTGKVSYQVAAAHDPFGRNSEELRLLRSQLMMRWFDTGRKALAVAAVDACDGTTTLVANLGVLLSQLKLRTIVVDANLRRPRLHTMFGLDCRTGVTDILVGHARLEAAHSIDSFPYLSILTAGTPALNASELASQGAFLEMQEELSETFDVILYDSPPFSSASDAYAIAAKVGGLLVVMRKDKTRMEDVAALRLRLLGTGVIGVGTVLVDF